MIFSHWTVELHCTMKVYCDADCEIILYYCTVQLYCNIRTCTHDAFSVHVMESTSDAHVGLRSSSIGSFPSLIDALIASMI